MSCGRKEFDEKINTEIKSEVSGIWKEARARAVSFKEWLDKYMEEPDAYEPLDDRHGPSTATNEERLAYYRSHGLDQCNDYPGGDSQFEEDVLSGKYHEFGTGDGDLGREDEYVVKCMYDGRFKFDGSLLYYGMHRRVVRGYYDNVRKNGIAIA